MFAKCLPSSLPTASRTAPASVPPGVKTCLCPSVSSSLQGSIHSLRTSTALYFPIFYCYHLLPCVLLALILYTSFSKLWSLEGTWHLPFVRWFIHSLHQMSKMSSLSLCYNNTKTDKTWSSAITQVNYKLEVLSLWESLTLWRFVNVCACAHMHVHMLVCVCMQVHMNICAHVCGSQKTATEMIPQVPSTLLLETGCLLGLEFAR